MKRRSFPLWLLRDVPALLGVLASFWSLVICAMINDRKAMRADHTGKAIRDHIAALLAHAEAHLDFALWRQAYRRIGWHPREAKFHLIAATTRWADTRLRLQNYCRAFGNMQDVVDAYVAHLRAQHRISKSELAAHGSTDAALCAAAHHELVGAVALFSPHAQFALILSSARSARPSKDERGHAHARGPPPHLSQNQENPPRRLHLRERACSSVHRRHITSPHFRRIRPRIATFAPQRRSEPAHSNCVGLVDQPVMRLADHHIQSVSTESTTPTGSA